MAREWFLSKEATEFCNVCGGATLEDDPIEPRIHVIEYQAFKQVDEQNKRLHVDSKLERALRAEAKLAIAVEALEKIKAQVGTSTEAWHTANKALITINAIRDNGGG